MFDSFLKRIFDILMSLLISAIGLPLWVLIAIAIKLGSPGALFFRTIRIGKGSIPFVLLKFRTMVAGAPGQGPGVTSSSDARITYIGHFLRKWKLDELPQLINVLRGDMSIVGPRPEDPRYVAHYTPEQKRVLSVRPGITGAAAIKYRHEEKLLALAGENLEEFYLAKIMPDKLEIELEYMTRKSFFGDLVMFFKTGLSLLASFEKESVRKM